jgi:uncharacterized protein
VIVPDVSVLIHAYNADSARHARVRRWWEETLSGTRQVGLPLASALGFVRIMTNPRFGLNPMPVKRCADHVRSWLAIPAVRVLTPGQDHLEILLRLIEQVGVAGNLTTDAHLAALAIEYRAELASTDVDFGRFQGLRWFDPS